jgi:hypothetical protein
MKLKDLFPVLLLTLLLNSSAARKLALYRVDASESSDGKHESRHLLASTTGSTVGATEGATEFYMNSPEESQMQREVYRSEEAKLVQERREWFFRNIRLLSGSCDSMGTGPGPGAGEDSGFVTESSCTGAGVGAGFEVGGKEDKNKPSDIDLDALKAIALAYGRSETTDQPSDIDLEALKDKALAYGKSQTSAYGSSQTATPRMDEPSDIDLEALKANALAYGRSHMTKTSDRDPLHAYGRSKTPTTIDLDSLKANAFEYGRAHMSKAESLGHLRRLIDAWNKSWL